MAHKVNRLLDPHDTGIRVSDSVMIVCAYEHMAYGFGFPQRIQDHDITKAFRESFSMVCSRQFGQQLHQVKVNKGDE